MPLSKSYSLTRRARLDELLHREAAYFTLKLMFELPKAHLERFIDLYGASSAQLRQDLVALSVNDFKSDGYFVEFGATDGRQHSNTWLLERDFGWTGILSEPARQWHDAIATNRNAVIETRCVWSSTGERLDFVEAPRGENSSISEFVPTRRKLRGESYEVETVSLNDLLSENGAPAVVDFLSVDTEGSEFEILNAVDFDRWSFNFITVEHNFGPKRDAIAGLLAENGYRKIYAEASRFDDWYVPAAAQKP